MAQWLYNNAWEGETSPINGSHQFKSGAYVALTRCYKIILSREPHGRKLIVMVKVKNILYKCRSIDQHQTMGIV